VDETGSGFGISCVEPSVYFTREYLVRLFVS
jgi:hypothetical protein